MQQTLITWEELSKEYISIASGVFLVVGKNSYAQSGAQGKLGSMLKNVPHVRFSAFTENPDIREISAGTAAFQSSNCNLILAIGGGSAMDVAKTIFLFADHNQNEHIALLKGQRVLDLKTIGTRSLITVPTTFGTGSESTHFSVVYIGERKYSLAHAAGLPTAYILDPSLALSASRATRATTGTDALCQAIESYWAVAATDESRAYASQATTLLKEHLVPFVTSPNLTVARHMANAANLAGRAINLTKTTAPHALSYAITKQYGVKHGHAVALTLSAFFELNVNRGTDRVKQSMYNLFDVIGVPSPSAAANWFDTLIAKTGQATRLSEITDFSPAEAVKLASEVNIERLKNHPVPLSPYDLIAALDR